jgi:hypothetical protein
LQNGFSNNWHSRSSGLKRCGRQRWSLRNKVINA